MNSVATILSAGFVAALISIGISSVGHSDPKANSTRTRQELTREGNLEPETIPQREVHLTVPSIDDRRPVARPVESDPILVERNTQFEPVSLDDMRAYWLHTFEHEATDTAWSRVTRSDIQERLRQVLTDQDVLQALDCRSTMCRVAIRHTSSAAFERLNSQFARGGRPFAWPHEFAGGKIADQPNGTVETEFFLAREGHTLPRLD